MKKLTAISSLALMLMVTIILSSCTSVNLQDPKEVGTAFLKYIEDGNLEKAKELCTAKAKDRLDEIDKLGQFENNLCKSYEVRDLIDHEKEPDSKKFLKFKPEGLTNNELELFLRKENEIWKVDDNFNLPAIITLKVDAFDLYKEDSEQKNSYMENKYKGRIVIVENLMLDTYYAGKNYCKTYAINLNSKKGTFPKNGNSYYLNDEKLTTVLKSSSGLEEGAFNIKDLIPDDIDKIEAASKDYGAYTSKYTYHTVGTIRGQLGFNKNKDKYTTRFWLYKSQIDSIN